MRDHSLSRFLSLLTESPPLEGVFNPWSDVDEENDVESHSPEIRLRHLRHYLRSRLDTARYLIIGEAVGYQGGHFSGIPMTSERILLGFQRERGIHPEHVLPGLKPDRTSRAEKMPLGYTEPTATIVWETIMKSQFKPTRFVLWNAFPWHPFDPAKGLLSNRRPKAREMEDVLEILKQFIYLFPHRRLIAMGRVAEERLDKLEVSSHPVRHPAQGGASAFKAQLSRLLRRTGKASVV
jgi:hypothetical protein